MVRKITAALIMFAAVSCHDAEENSEQQLKNPAETHPPSEAIPDSTRLVNDSVIVADTTRGNGSQVGSSDSIRKKQR